MYVNCATPPPSPNTSWDLSFNSGNGTAFIQYGGYDKVIATNPFVKCVVGKGISEFAAVTSAIAYLKQNPAWTTGPNAPLIRALINDYQAGEIGASAALAGIVVLTDVATLLAIAGLLGLSVYELLELLDCSAQSGMASMRLGAAALA